jgi:HK97 family phage major capsid protein
MLEELRRLQDDGQGASEAYKRIKADVAKMDATIANEEELQRQEAEMARSLHNRGNGRDDFGYPTTEKVKHYDRSALLAPNESVRDYMQSKGMVERNGPLDGLSVGAYLRAMVVGAKTEQEKRALSEGSDGAGGYTVPDILFPQIVDNLRSAQVCVKAGAKTLVLESDQNRIATLLTDPVAAWRAENAPVAESDPTFGAIDLKPETLAVFCKVSVELLEDSVNIERMLQSAFTGALAVELDRVALRGNGVSNEPLGLTGLGINHQPALGPFSDYDPLVDGQALTWAANEQVTSAVIMSPVNYATLVKLREVPTGQYLRRPSSLENVPFLQTTGMDDDTAILGNFARLIIGIRTQIKIIILRELFMGNMQYAYMAYLRADVGVENAGSFTRVTNLTAS